MLRRHFLHDSLAHSRARDHKNNIPQIDSSHVQLDSPRF